MEKQKEHARQYGYTETIDCGALSLHFFHEDYLAQNTPLDKSMDLASCTFSDRNIPRLESSGLEILPNSESSQRELHGYVNFDLPSSWNPSQVTYDRILKLFKLHLDNKVSYDFIEYQSTHRTLLISVPSQNDIMISFWPQGESSATFELSTPLDTNKPSSFLYNDILFSSSVWGELHDFVVQADADLPFSNYAAGMKNEIYIGETGKLFVSELQIAIDSLRTVLQSNTPEMTLPTWSPNIDGKLLSNTERMLSTTEIAQIARNLLREKRRKYGETGESDPITLDDIISKTRLLLPPHRQEPPENSRRD